MAIKVTVQEFLKEMRVRLSQTVNMASFNRVDQSYHYDDLLNLLEDELCHHCGALLEDTDFTHFDQPQPYGMGVAYESIVDGYTCSLCQHTEKW